MQTRNEIKVSIDNLQFGYANYYRKHYLKADLIVFFRQTALTVCKTQQKQDVRLPGHSHIQSTCCIHDGSVH